MHTETLPAIASLPFVVLVLSIAVMPLSIPKLWSRHDVQGLVAAVCALPVLALLWHHGAFSHLSHVGQNYLSFVITIGALYTIAGNIYVNGDLEATPLTNVSFVAGGSILASIIGTTGASVLLIRPLLRTNEQREHKGHLVPIFILAVANAGGLLTPLGDPPLLVGYLNGVPFLWTLRLLPAWLLYVGSFCALLYVVDRRAYAKESPSACVRDRREVEALTVRGAHNVLCLLGIVLAVGLPVGYREAVIVAITLVSFFATPAKVRELNGFGFGPILEVAILFAGLFACLAPIEEMLASHAPHLPIQKSWQLFWVTGLLSSLLDNAPTYAAFSALAKGLSSGGGLVAGIEPNKLAAISMGSVLMGATTYIGNGPNLMVKSIAEAHRYPMPSFARYAVFALLTMMPAHIVSTIVLAVFDP